MTNVRKKTGMSRREFLRFTWAFSVLGLFGQASMALWRFFKPRIAAGAFGSQVNAGFLGEFEPGTVSHVQAGRYYISRLEDGGLLALWQRCTHLGCTVPWDETAGEFRCPCHSSVFNRVGEVISGPAPRPMDLFPITIEDNQIVVNTGEAIQRDKFDPSQVTHV